MSIIVRNVQRVVSVRRTPIRLSLEIARSCLGVKCFDMAVICASNAKMRRINRIYRGKDTATDVLSFPFYEDLHAGSVPVPSFKDEYNLGDIYLGVEYIYQQCQEMEDDFISTCTVTAVHGFCHLLGYRHDSVEEWRQMFDKEREILTEINKVTGYSLKPLTTNHL
ncbi:endoribonuclease YbeY [Pelobates fuscus]|uniref:endoribonuclease YbeY n=1 Tax=Pelobates fuscus TaxID=191477 RepID=UPI002FE4CDAC